MKTTVPRCATEIRVGIGSLDHRKVVYDENVVTVGLEDLPVDHLAQTE